jgi:ribonuclease HI
MKLTIFTDGGARGNPGPAATGIVVKDEGGKIIDSFGEYLGEQTNNYAEYSALIAGMKKAKELGADELECVLDSELVVKQMQREYKVKEPTLQKKFIEAYNSSVQFKKITFRHTERKNNKDADAIVNKILDERK